MSANPSSTINDVAFGDLDREFRLTRRVLERIPQEHFPFKPHEKSMHFGRLAMHVATLPQWMHDTIAKDAMDLNSPPKIRFEPADKDDLLKTFDQNVAAVKQAMAAIDDAGLLSPWTLRQGDQVLYRDTKAKTLRIWCVNHMVHHRAQLCIYLRLLNVPVPAVYFNSADEPAWVFE
jgi:uncharacterized damage-inducible protein DinB